MIEGTNDIRETKQELGAKETNYHAAETIAPEFQLIGKDIRTETQDNVPENATQGEPTGNSNKRMVI